MSEALKRKDYLSLLGSTRQKKKRSLLLDYASNGDIAAISEVIFNLLKGIIPLNDKQRRTLRKYQRVLRAISKKTLSYKTKRHILKQEGGFLPTLIPIALSVLSSLL